MKANRFLLAAGILLAMAFTQSFAQQNITTFAVDKRAVGTWVDKNGETLVFNSDGTGKFGGKFSIKYAFFSNKMVWVIDTNSTYVADYVFSADGKTFIIMNANGYAYWLTKKEE